jgi:GT2 family glycosyltransferase
MIIIDNSDLRNECKAYLKTLRNTYTTIISLNQNIGHGRGMDRAIKMAKTPLVLIMDSDTMMLKSPVEEMLELMDEDTYGVGWIYETGHDGYDFGAFPHHKDPIPYLHPYFALINVEQYKKFHPFIHHGAPAFKAMLDIYNAGLSGKILKSFPGLTGHTSGRGTNWTGTPNKYIRHDFGGTRMIMKKLRRQEIEGKWEL